MKKRNMVLLGLATVGVPVFGTLFHYMKHRKKYCECHEDENCFDFGDLPEAEDEEYLEKDAYEPDITMDACEKTEHPYKDHGCYVTAQEMGFIKYMLEGISDINIITGDKFQDVKKLSRRKNIKASDRMSDIGYICDNAVRNTGLLERCVNNILMIFNNDYPEDYFEYMKDRRETNKNGEE